MDKRIVLSAIFATAAGVVVSCGGGGGSSISTTTTTANETENATKAIVEGNVPAGLVVDNQTGDVRADAQVVTDVWAIVDNTTYYGGYFEQVNGTYKFVIPDLPVGVPYVISFVNGTPNNLDNETVVALTPPIVVQNATAVVTLTDVTDGIANVDTQNSVGVVVVDNATLLEQLKQAVGKPAKEALAVISNATQVAQEQVQNATVENATLTEGWYRNYAVGLYETKYAFNVQDSGGSIKAQNLITFVENGVQYVLVDDGTSVNLYKIEDGTATKINVNGVTLNSGDSFNLLKVGNNGVILLEDQTTTSYYIIDLNTGNGITLNKVDGDTENYSYLFGVDTTNKVVYRLVYTDGNLTYVKGNNALSDTNNLQIKVVDENNAWLAYDDGTDTYVAKVSYDGTTLNVNEQKIIAGTTITNAKIEAASANIAYFVGDDKNVYRLDAQDLANPVKGNNVLSGTNNLQIKVVDENNAWLAYDDDTDTYVAKVSYDGTTLNVNEQKIQNYKNLSIVPTKGINAWLIPGKPQYFVIEVDNPTNTIVVYYGASGFEYYPVDKGVDTINAAEYIQEPTKVILYDSSNYIKVFAFNFDNNMWEEESKLYFDKTTPTSITQIDGETYTLDDGNWKYLVKYQNGILQVSEEAVPVNAASVEYCGDYSIVDTGTGYAEVYYETYNDLTQWGNLKVKVHLPDAANGGAASAYVYNNTIYVATSDGTNGLDVALISLENQKDATPENTLDIAGATKIVPIDDNRFAATDGEVIYIADVNGTNDNIKAVNIAVKDITSDGTYVYGVDDDSLYRVNPSDLSNISTKLTDTVTSALEKVAYINGAIAVAGITTDNQVAVKMVDPGTLQSLSDWVKVGDYNTGDPIDLAVAGNYLIVDVGSTAYIVNAADTANPELVNATISDIKGISVFGNIGYGITSDGKIAKLDVSNPASPTIVNKVDIGNYTSETVTSANLYAYGDYVFLTSGDNRVEIYNFANVTNSTDTVGYMGDAYTASAINSYYVKLINGKYYLISADGSEVQVLNLNPKEVK